MKIFNYFIISILLVFGYFSYYFYLQELRDGADARESYQYSKLLDMQIDRELYINFEIRKAYLKLLLAQ